uniref:Uncharacterized protein n=1 Tax=Anguilla anguilla TaxID=7936 RepID=A0A0E9TX80_ANGAN
MARGYIWFHIRHNRRHLIRKGDDV